jgi:hypothetical protein
MKTGDINIMASKEQRIGKKLEVENFYFNRKKDLYHRHLSFFFFYTL